MTSHAPLAADDLRDRFPGRQRPDGPYVTESFSTAEQELLRPYFTNLDGPVFALVNLPEVVKGALFARYSRSEKSLRRLFLDEFVGDLDTSGTPVDAAAGLRRAEELYNKVFFEYGDDSVAQLGGVHLACEQASNLLTKVLEWGRLASYLEQSTRYIAYSDRRSDGTWRYYRAPEILASPLGERYATDLDATFATYSALAEELGAFLVRERHRLPEGSERAFRAACRAKALDAVRGLLPAATLSNVGIYASGQSYEAMLVRMRSHPLAEVRAYASLVLAELRKVIPSFLRRVDLPARGSRTSAYLAENRDALDVLAQELDASATAGRDTAAVTLVDFDPAAEEKLVAAALYPHSTRSETELRAQAAAMSADERARVLAAFCGERDNRRHRPGRALELPVYRFDVLGDYGAFRDLQRHRMATIEWQRLGPAHGYEVPDVLVESGLHGRYEAALERSAKLHAALEEAGFAEEASYAVAFAYRVRFQMTFNAREAMHLLELRTQPAGHDSYRRIAQEMHRQIAEIAGHRAIAGMMRFVDHTSSQDRLGRLGAEIAADRRRT